VPGGEEFLIITEWDSVQAIEAFAGEDAESAVVPAKVQEMMVEYDKKATHYEIAHQQ
jgi:heme-degrading monooxygenase HmoA